MSKLLPQETGPPRRWDIQDWWRSASAGKRAGLVGLAGLAVFSFSTWLGLGLLGWAFHLWAGTKGLKLAACIALDIFDFTVGRLLIVGLFGGVVAASVIELLSAAVAAAMWGPLGWLAALEILEPTGQLDAFIPSCTLIAMRCWNKTRA